MIQTQNLTFAYSNQPPIFKDFNWQVRAGEAWAVLGPSGCGKSTLLYLLAGLRAPTSGQILISGEPLTKPRPHTGLILQDYGLLPWATVAENAGLGLRIRQFYGPDGRHAPTGPAVADAVEVVDGWLHQLGIDGVRDKYPGQISGGQRQRTAIARTLALDPDLLLMDEPFASLDAPTRQNLGALIQNLRREHHLTTVIVTHAIEEAALLGERIMVLGQPPHFAPVVIENPDASSEGYINSSAYTDVCARLRETLAVTQ
jgi:NitT/TauT family transport system ATP-binding protein